jgi:hypothetical protein
MLERRTSILRASADLTRIDGVGPSRSRARRRLGCVALASFALFGVPAAAEGAWHQPVGGVNPIDQAVNRDANDPSLAVSGGVPYVAWTEDDGTNDEVRVSRLNQAGTAWEQVVGGPSPINQADDESARYTSLTVIGGVPYVAWTETDGTNYEVRVSRLNRAGNAWEQVVGGASPINQDPNRSASQPSLAAIGGVPYVAWDEGDGTNGEVRVSRLNQAGTAWEQVVGGASPLDQAADGNTEDPRLADIGGVPYVTWDENDGTNFEVRVSRLNQAGTAWQQVPGGPSPVNQDPSGDAFFPAMAEIGGITYLAWSEFDATSSKVRVSRLNSAGTAWEQVGGGASPVNRDPGRSAFEPSLTAIGGVPYVAWAEFDGTNYEVRVARLGRAGAAWEEVVGGASPINQATDSDAEEPSLTAIGGVPYVAWREGGSNPQVRVSRLEPELSAPEVVVNDSSAVLLTQVNSFGVPYRVAFEHGPNGTFGARTALVTSAGGTDTVHSTLTGLAAGTGYQARAVGSDGTFFYAPSATTNFSTAASPPPQGRTITVPGPVQTVTRLLVATVHPKLKGRSGKRVVVEYLSTATGQATLEVLNGRKRIARITTTAKVGRNKIAWNGKQGRKKAKPGRYTLNLQVTGGDGQVATDPASLTIKR